MSYKDKPFKNVSSGDLGIEAEEQETDQEKQENQELFAYMKNQLSGKVTNVKASKRLKNHPVCLSSEGEITIEMEKILNAQPNNPNIKANKVLEINIHHEVFQTLKDAFEKDKDKLNLYTNLLYNQALLIEGLPIEDPVQFTNDMCKIMV